MAKDEETGLPTSEQSPIQGTGPTRKVAIHPGFLRGVSSTPLIRFRAR